MRILALAAAFVAGTFSSISAQSTGGKVALDLLGEARPRVFFFRNAEQTANTRLYPDLEVWDRAFSRLGGIMGKCLEEELPGRMEKNPGYFTEFKRRHPNQVVLLHLNGNARDPRFETGAYFPGHWIYREATLVLEDVPAESGESVIKVKSARDFRTDTGRYRSAADDLALFDIAPDGRHDWASGEQMTVLSVDRSANTLRVRRGQYGTKPRAFRAGKSRAAAHEVEGPWGRNSHLLWLYNYSLQCPKDADGMSAADRYVSDIARWFGPRGLLSNLDGLEFDVFFHVTTGDTDGDGVVDDGIVGGVNAYGQGTVDFARKLRARMGPSFILMGDGALGVGGVKSQRAFGIFNGIESEGFPNLQDWAFEDWSGALNRHRFWFSNAHGPSFHYINHKWNEPVPGKPGETRAPDVPFSRHRLAFAGAEFADAMMCGVLMPPGGKDGSVGIWDEWWAGTEKRLGWLGVPEGPAVHLATRTPDLLGGSGQGAALPGHMSGEGRFERTDDGVRVVTAPGRSRTTFTFRGIPIRGPHLYLEWTMKGDPLAGFSGEVARFVSVAVSGGGVDLLAQDPVDSGFAYRGKPEEPMDKASGAQVSPRRKTRLGEDTLPSLLTHPPTQGPKGYTYWCQDAWVPQDGELRFSIGMGEKSPERSDGVWFSVWVAEIGNDVIGPFTRIFEANTKESRWIAQRVPLPGLGQKRLRFKFVADCGPRDHAVTDHAYWGRVRLATSSVERETPLVSPPGMTWVNGRFFTSGYGLWDLSGETLDLTFDVEGPEPVVLQSLRAYGAPDTVMRAYRKGLILANPSRSPQTFDLGALQPGKSYRRLSGTENQDRQANDGKPVGATLTLGERDAIFLQRER